jgi:hypothetical protein
MSTDCAAGDPVSPQLAEEFRCDHQRVPEVGSRRSQ